MRFQLILPFLAICGFLPLAAQSGYKLDPQKTGFFVDGTSTTHDWTMTLDQGRSRGAAQFKIKGGKITGVQAMELTVEAEGLKSGKGGMDNTAYKALKTDQHKEMTFQLDKVEKIENKDGGFAIRTQGRLTIAGSTQPVDLAAACRLDGEAVSCSGSKTIKMTDFGMQPPTALLGSIQTGDEITIRYEAVFVRE